MLRPELRVYRVGQAMLGFSLSSPDIDYRTHQRVRLKPTRVPRVLEQKLHVFCEDLGLDFAAADFMRDPGTGDYRFLEVNSQPMFAAFDQVSGGRLCDAIIDHLEQGSKLARA
jgi:glutathione synthase/RimK-type ligase-like ATP-grasp enzyme